jgi:hypothetical protein
VCNQWRVSPPPQRCVFVVSMMCVLITSPVVHTAQLYDHPILLDGVESSVHSTGVQRLAAQQAAVRCGCAAWHVAVKSPGGSAVGLPEALSPGGSSQPNLCMALEQQQRVAQYHISCWSIPAASCSRSAVEISPRARARGRCIHVSHGQYPSCAGGIRPPHSGSSRNLISSCPHLCLPNTRERRGSVGHLCAQLCVVLPSGGTQC